MSLDMGHLVENGDKPVAPLLTKWLDRMSVSGK